MAENKYICQSCFHKGMCLEYDDECYGCPHYVNTADVAPRSEVAREIFAGMGATAFTMHDDDSGEFILCMYCEDFEEIKQKYTEEQK